MPNEASTSRSPSSVSQSFRNASPVLSTEIPSEQLLPHIRDLAERLKTANRDELIDEVMVIRRELARGRSTSEPEMLVAGLALVSEALRRSKNIRLYDVQLLAVAALSRNRIAQMQTGEGKTFVGIAASGYLGMAGRGVHVITPNTYLAERDQSLAAPVLAELGMTAGLLPERVEAIQKFPAYDCDVTYGTGHEFGFDYLRDQLTLRQESRRPAGSRLLQALQEPADGRRITMQRGLEYAVVDEADSVLIDDAGSPLVLSMSAQDGAPDASAHQMAMQLLSQLEPEKHYQMDAASGLLMLTGEGIQRCHSADVRIPVPVLIRPWTEYVQQALRARLLFRRDVHYVVEDDEVRIVDETTGRIFEDRSWQDGLHQAIEAKEGLKITAEKSPLAQITRQRFFRIYNNLCGMTGTAIGCEQELKEVYRLKIEEIPLRVPSARQLMPTRYFATRKARWNAIAEEIIRKQKAGRAVLVGTRSIADTDVISRLLAELRVPHQVLNGLQTADEADIVSHAGQPGSVTIATNLAGRGTDISLHPDVKRQGGLHVIVSECQNAGRMDRQLIGRCGRQGDPGSAQVFASAEDTLLTNHGPWLAAAIQREADASGETFADFATQLRRVQQAAERQQYVGRMQLLQRDSYRDKLFRHAR
ncbi:MAG: hypothetical protein R3C20_10750 [Planctomycetaceae bacterium]